MLIFGYRWRVLLARRGLFCLKQWLDGFYGSKNVYMNTRVQCFPLEHYAVAMINVIVSVSGFNVECCLMWLVDAYSEEDLHSSDFVLTPSSLNRTKSCMPVSNHSWDGILCARVRVCERACAYPSTFPSMYPVFKRLISNCQIQNLFFF